MRVAPESGRCVSVQGLNLPQVGAYMIELLLIALGLWWPLKSSLSNQSLLASCSFFRAVPRAYPGMLD